MTRDDSLNRVPCSRRAPQSAHIAQWLEHHSFKMGAPSSNLGVGTMTTRSIVDEALEITLTQIEVLDDEIKVCIVCWGIFNEGSCTCENPIWWPREHAVRRLRLLLGYDG